MDFSDIQADSKDSSTSESSSGTSSKRTNVFLKGRYGTTVVSPSDCEFCDKVGRKVIGVMGDADSPEYTVVCGDHVDEAKDEYGSFDFERGF